MEGFKGKTFIEDEITSLKRRFGNHQLKKMMKKTMITIPIGSEMREKLQRTLTEPELDKMFHEHSIGSPDYGVKINTSGRHKFRTKPHE